MARVRSRVPASLLERYGEPIYRVPCTIVQVTPLLVDMMGGTNLPATKVAGATYTLNAPALAYISATGVPQVLPIGV